MIRDRLDAFVTELRAVGLPISLSDKMDALRSLRLVPLDDRDQVEMALLSTMVKRGDHIGAFRAVFDIFFARAGDESVAALADGDAAETEAGGETDAGPSALDRMDNAELNSLLAEALANDDRFLLRLLAREAVARHGGFQPGRPVGGVYYVMRTLRALRLPAAQEAFTEDLAQALDRGDIDSLGARLRTDQYEVDLDYLRKEIDAEVRRLVAADRGAEALAESVRKPVLNDTDFMSATADDIAEMRRALAPLSRVLASRLQRRRRHGRKGTLDFRRTIRRSMAYGGVPADLRFHPPRPTKPELVILADISGSVSSFARFTLELLYALHDQFSKVRCFVFIDGVSEITELLADSADLSDLAVRMNKETAVTWTDGHSDYGHALRLLADEWPDAITQRSTFIVMGDARSNYRIAEQETFAKLARSARHVFWLNPEPRVNWDTGDSIVSAYAPFCDEVRECRTLGQLRDFVENLA